MGIYGRARRLALGIACASGLVAGMGMIAAPGSAFAACITGSGSSLQAEQQSLWDGTDAGSFMELYLPACVEYTATSSGQGLEEFGVGSGVLKPEKSGNGSTLDDFIGTDDPPTATQIAEMETAFSGDKVWTMPIIAAPVAVIVHPPAACKVGGTIFNIPNELLEAAWKNVGLTWNMFLKKLKEAIGPSFSFTEGEECGKAVLREVRSDSSGTSFAFKQYLCQINSATWGAGGECESGDGFVTDEATWPAEVDTQHIEDGETVPNKGSSGEAKAVALTEGTIGYVNLANAHTAGFEEYGSNQTTFWATVENGEEPNDGTGANCPSTYTFPNGTVEEEAEKEGKWSKVHLANPNQSDNYPICTFTYDVAPEAGNTETRAYFEYMAAKGEGQSTLHEYYGALPGSVREIAEKIAPKAG